VKKRYKIIVRRIHRHCETLAPSMKIREILCAASILTMLQFSTHLCVS